MPISLHQSSVPDTSDLMKAEDARDLSQPGFLSDKHYPWAFHVFVARVERLKVAVLK
jgi:hypothetical protein